MYIVCKRIFKTIIRCVDIFIFQYLIHFDIDTLPVLCLYIYMIYMIFAHFLLLIYFGFKPWIYCRANPGNLSSPSLPDSPKKIISIFSFQKNNVFDFNCLNKEFIDVIKAKVCFVEVYIYLKILTGLVIWTPYLLPPHRHLAIYKYIFFHIIR